LAFLLTILLGGFGVTAYRLFCSNQNHAIYEQLQRHLSAIAGDLNPKPPGRHPSWNGDFENPEFFRRTSVGGFTEDANCETNQNEAPKPLPLVPQKNPQFDPPERGSGPAPQDLDPEWKPGPRQPRQPEFDQPMGEPGRRKRSPFPPEPPAINLSPDVESLFAQTNANSFYYLVWNNQGEERLRSANTPASAVAMPRTERTGGPQIRTQGEFVESYLQHTAGFRVLVGRSIAEELTVRKEFAVTLVMAGLIVLAVGICGGWWLTGRALQPIHHISTSASRISAGNLSERIDSSTAGTELGQLATTLNSTFSRLEAAFVQQKQFTADASHELRTPLAVMISEAQTTLARPRSEQEYRETVETCLTTAQQMRLLTESLLALARYDSGGEPLIHSRLDLAEIAADCVAALQPLAAEKSLHVETNLTPTIATGDPNQIRQVITNLISNAICYNTFGGSITVSSHRSDHWVELMVEDSGVGIAPEELPKIFRRFYRADKARSRAEGHSGLGLAICKVIVAAHQGEILVASTLGVGSRFTLRLQATTNAA